MTTVNENGKWTEVNEDELIEKVENNIKRNVYITTYVIRHNQPKQSKIEQREICRTREYQDCLKIVSILNQDKNGGWYDFTTIDEDMDCDLEFTFNWDKGE